MTIAIDFDGVIHKYSQGWKDGTIYDPPIDGALDAIRLIQQHDAVVIHTTRDPQQVADWLGEYDIPCRVDWTSVFWDNREVVLVTNRKPAAYVYIDDRGLWFLNWHQTINALRNRSLLPRPAHGSKFQ